MRIGTRRSALALAQARLVAGQLGVGEAELVAMASAGDRGGDRGGAAGDKSRWVSELELALQEGRIDLAVHSAKDVPGELAEGLALFGCPPRAAAEDVLCGGGGGIAELPPGARVGTSSLRRLAQLRAARADLEVVTVRGNVDTRLAKLAAGEDGLRALVLARAGLQRLGREEAAAAASLDPAVFVPAPGQGALALEGRAGDEAVRAAVAAIADAPTTAALAAERAVAGELGADCDTPLGAHAVGAGGALRLRAWVGLPDGSRWALDELEGDAADPDGLGRAVAERLTAVGARALLAEAREAAAHG